MKNLKKQKQIAIALTILLSLSAFFAISTQTAKAATTYPTYIFIAAAPNPAGVGQSVLVTAFIDRYPPSNASNFYRIYVDFVFKVTITDPNGDVETKTILSDPVGGSTFNFVPDIVGTWKLKVHFEGAGPIAQSSNNTYLASDSNVFSLEVQQEPAKAWDPAPLPTEYWQRPIYGENREWATIAGSWPGLPHLRDSGYSTYDGVNGFNPYSPAPESAHIMWMKPLRIGGIVGAPSTEAFYTGDSYERVDRPAIILAGIFYRNLPQNNNPTGNGFEAIDLRTGKTLWTVPNGTISWGQLLKYDTLNQHGVIPYLWNTNLQVFDANTGGFLLQFANITSGSRIMDDMGNVLSYTYTYSAARNNGTLVLWNSTKAINGGPYAGGFGAGNPDYWRPGYGQTSFDWRKGVEWNVTISGLRQYGVEGSPSISQFDPYDDVVICRYVGPSNDTYPVGYEVLVGYSMIDGHQMWVQKYTNFDQITTAPLGGASVGVAPGYFFYYKQETLQWFAHSATTGELVWRTEPYTDPWSTYYTTLSVTPLMAAYDKIYTIAYDGKLHCYDPTDGRLLWEALGYSSGTETPYGSWPTSYMAIADGKVYVGNGEHSPNQPLYRGYALYCVDAETGDLIWQVSNYAQAPMIADGYLLVFNGYDMQNYCFGKGPSATTVSAGPKSAIIGDKVVIEGMVTDVSPGTADYTQTARFPQGVPAVSDDSQSQWMEYVYMQQPLPTNTTGVEVWIDVLDANGNYRNIGKTNSDLSGFYSFDWQPDIPGKYTVVATFHGSESYYGSYSETAFTVADAPVVVPVETPVSNTDAYVLYAAIAIIVAIAIVGIVIILVVRKRP